MFVRIGKHIPVCIIGPRNIDSYCFVCVYNSLVHSIAIEQVRQLSGYYSNCCQHLEIFWLLRIQQINEGFIELYICQFFFVPIIRIAVQNGVFFCWIYMYHIRWFIVHVYGYDEYCIWDSVLYMYSIYNKQKQGRCMFINNFEKWIKLTFFIKKK